MTPDNQPALPELPEPDGEISIMICGQYVDVDAYRASTMKAYALESLRRAEGATLGEAAVDLRKVYDAFGIGDQARTIPILLTNIHNTKRFAAYLHAVEREFFMVPGEPDEDFPDDEPEDDCLVNSWGSTKDEYIEQFRKALTVIATPTSQRVPAVDYDRELIIGMLENPSDYTVKAIAEQVSLLRTADNAEAAGVHTAQRVAAGDEVDKTRLWDSQWVNIVNHPDVLNATEAAVAKAVKMTEQKMAENFARYLSSTPPPTGEAVGYVRRHDLTRLANGCSDVPLFNSNAGNDVAVFTHPPAQAEGRVVVNIPNGREQFEIYACNQGTRDFEESSGGGIRYYTNPNTEAKWIYWKASRDALAAPADVGGEPK